MSIITEERLCKKHGLFRHILEKSGRYRCSKCRTEAVQRRRDSIKLKAVEYKGGSCVRCGYNAYIAALEFHHVEPEHKDFAISKEGHTRSWDRVKEEIDKCILVCCRCHREVHADEHLSKKAELQVGKRNSIGHDNCPVCNKEKQENMSTCSVECAGIKRSKVEWSAIDIKQLLSDNNGNYSAVGRILGISDNAVRKRLKKETKIVK